MGAQSLPQDAPEMHRKPRVAPGFGKPLGPHFGRFWIDFGATLGHEINEKCIEKYGSQASQRQPAPAEGSAGFSAQFG